MPWHCCVTRCFAEAVPIIARLCHYLANGGQLYNAEALRWGCGVRLSIASALLCRASLRHRRASPGFVGQCHARATPSLGPAKPCQCHVLTLLRHAHASYRTASPLHRGALLCPCFALCWDASHCQCSASPCIGLPSVRCPCHTSGRIAKPSLRETALCRGFVTRCRAEASPG